MIKIRDLITQTARITINAVMLAAAVQVHVIAQSKPGVRLLNRADQSLGADRKDMAHRLSSLEVVLAGVVGRVLGQISWQQGLRSASIDTNSINAANLWGR